MAANNNNSKKQKKPTMRSKHDASSVKKSNVAKKNTIKKTKKTKSKTQSAENTQNLKKSAVQETSKSSSANNPSDEAFLPYTEPDNKNSNTDPVQQFKDEQFAIIEQGNKNAVANKINIESSQQIRQKKRKKKKRLKILRTFIIILIVLLISAAVAGFIYLYNTDYFKIENVKINGVSHLTEQEMYTLADIPEDTTLLRVDTDTIVKRLKMDAWIHDVNIVRVFPDTLEINVTERTITAIVDVPTSSQSISGNSGTKKENVIRYWAISADHIWLMPVPDKNSEVAKNINQQIYNDVEGVMHILDVSPSVQPEIGSPCTDDVVNCAIDVVAAMTTELKHQVKYVKATDANSTNLVLNNGVEVAIGTSDDLRNKERVCLELLSKYQGKISYINVRNAAAPTWRSI